MFLEGRCRMFWGLGYSILECSENHSWWDQEGLSCGLGGEHRQVSLWVLSVPKWQLRMRKQRDSSFYSWEEVTGKKDINIYLTIEIGNYSIKCFRWKWATFSIIRNFLSGIGTWFCMLSKWAAGDGERLPFGPPLGTWVIPIHGIRKLGLESHLTLVFPGQIT